MLAETASQDVIPSSVVSASQTRSGTALNVRWKMIKLVSSFLVRVPEGPNIVLILPRDGDEFVEPVGPEPAVVHQPVVEFLQRSRNDVVHPSLGNGFRPDDAGLAEHPEVPGNRGPADGEPANEESKGAREPGPDGTRSPNLLCCPP